MCTRMWSSVSSSSVMASCTTPWSTHITPSHHHTITPSHHHIITSSHHHTITSSHHYIISPSTHHMTILLVSHTLHSNHTLLRDQIFGFQILMEYAKCWIFPDPVTCTHTTHHHATNVVLSLRHVCSNLPPYRTNSPCEKTLFCV